MSGISQRLIQCPPPMLADTQQKLLDLLEKPATRNIDLQNVILLDPGAAVAVFGRLHKLSPTAMDDVTDIQHAIGMMGLGVFEDLIKSARTVNFERQDAENNAGYLYSQLAHAAHYAMAIGELSGQNSPEQLATAALVQHSTVLALWHCDAESALRATNATRDGVSDEIAFYGELHCDIKECNPLLADAWGLPLLARQTLDSWSAFNPRPLIINLASELAKTTAADWHSEETTTAIELLEGYLPNTVKNPTGWLMQEGVKIARKLEHLPYPLSAYTRLYQPGEIEIDEALLEPGKNKRKAKSTSPQKKHATSSAPLDINRIIGSYMKRMIKDTGNQRIVFAMLTPNRGEIRTRLALGGSKTDELRKFSAPMNKKNLFSALMKKPQGLWLNPDNLSRYKGHIPNNLLPAFSPNGFLVSSLFIKNSPIGMIIADNASDPSCSETQYKIFRKYCQKISQTLTEKSGT